MLRDSVRSYLMRQRCGPELLDPTLLNPAVADWGFGCRRSYGRGSIMVALMHMHSPFDCRMKTTQSGASNT